MDAQNPFPPYKPARYVKLKNGRRYIEYYVWNANTLKLQRVRDYSIERECTNTREREEFAKAFIKTINDALRKGAHLSAAQSSPKAKKKSKTATLLDHLYEAAETRGKTGKTKTKYAYTKSVSLFDEYLTSVGKRLVAPSEVTAATLHKFQDWLIAEKRANRTVNNYTANLRSLFNHLIDREVLQVNPAMKLKKLAEVSTAHRYYEPKPQAALEEWLRTNDIGMYRFTRLVYFCFLRPNEIMGLRIQDVDLQGRKILVPGSVSKNKKTQSVTIPGSFLAEMQTWQLDTFPADFYLCGKELLPSPYKAPREKCSRRHAAALKAIGLFAQGYDLYSWKHTGVVNAYKAGVDVKALQQQLRHHSLEMTDIYLRGLGLSTNKVLEEKEW